MAATFSKEEFLHNFDIGFSTLVQFHQICVSQPTAVPIRVVLRLRNTSKVTICRIQARL